MKVELDKFKIMYWEVVHESNTIKRRWNTLIEQRDELQTANKRIKAELETANNKLNLQKEHFMT